MGLLKARNGYRIVWSCEEAARTCVAEVFARHRASFSVRLPHGGTLTIAGQRFRVPPERAETAAQPEPRKALPTILFDIGADDMERIERFYHAWVKGKRETSEMMDALDDYAGGRGKRHNLDLIRASWDEARRRAEQECVTARDAAFAELWAKYSLREILSERDPGHPYWQAREAIHDRELACGQVAHIIGLADGRVLVWLTSSVEGWPTDQPKPWEIVREQIELVDAVEEITRHHAGEDGGEGPDRHG